MKTLTIKQKLSVLSHIRKELISENKITYPYAKFLCTAFRYAVYCLGYQRKYGNKSDIFPELKAEIIRIGLENNETYIFPNQLYFKNDDGKLVETNHLRGKNVIWYNKKKLEMVSTVRKQITKGKY